MNTMEEMVAAVKQYALDHYADGVGWDMVAECMSDDDIKEDIVNADATSNYQAIKEVARFAQLWAEMQEDVTCHIDY